MKARRIRRLLIVALVAIALLVAFAPTLLGLGPGRALVAGFIDDHVDGVVSVDTMRLGWFSGQSIGGLRITDADGRPVVDVDVSVAAGLLALATGGVDVIEIDISGSVRGELRPDGSTSFADIVASSDPKTPPDEKKTPKDEKKTSAPDAGPALAGVPAVVVTLDGLELVVDFPAANPTLDPTTLTVERLAGTIAYAPGGACTVDLESPTRSGDLQGAVTVKGSVTNLIDANGAIDARGATAELTVTGRGLPVPLDDRVDRIERLQVSLTSPDVTKWIEIELSLDTIADDVMSELRGQLVIAAPVTPEGVVQLGLERVRGHVAGETVPTALLQPLLAGTPFVLTRDVGPTVDVEAMLGAPLGGPIPDPTDPMSIELSIDAEHVAIELAGSIAPDGAIDGTVSSIRAILTPELFAGLFAGPLDASSGLALETPVGFHATLESFHVPARDAQGRLALGDVRLIAGLTLEDELRLTAGAEAFTAGDMYLEIVSSSLATDLTVTGAASVFGGRIEIEERVTGLFDAAGEIDAAGVVPIGAIHLRDLDGVAVAALLHALRGEDALAGPAGALVDATLSGPINASVTTSAVDATPGALAVSVIARGTAFRLAADATRRGETFDVVAASAMLRVTPELAAALQESPDPVSLLAPTRLTITTGGIELPHAMQGDFTPGGAAIDATLAVTDTRVVVPDLAEAVLVSAPETRLTYVPGATPRVEARGTAAFRRVPSGKPIAVAAYDVGVDLGDEDVTPRGRVDLSELRLANVEALVGMTPETLTAWLGASGAAQVELAGGTVVLHADLPALQGAIEVSMTDDVLHARAEGVQVVVKATVLEAMLNAPPEDDEPVEPAARVPDDVPMTMTLASLALPLAAAQGKPFDPASFTLDATLRGGPLRMTHAGGVLTTIENLTLALDSDDLAQGVHVKLNATASAGGVAEPGIITLVATVRDLVKDSRLDVDGATLDATVTAERVPTLIADALLGLETLLVAAVGPEMRTSWTAEGFSRRAGRLDGRLEATNGFIAGRLLGGEGVLLTTSDAPIHGALEVTPALREHLLRKMHPVLADVRTTEQPVLFRLTAPSQIPVDGDVSRLHADLEITIGAVEFNPGSTSLGLLQAFTGNGHEQIPGSIEPIIGRIREGVITYDRFAVHIDEYTLHYQGRIDLVTQTLDLRTEVPLQALAGTFREVEGYVEDLVVPIVTRGTLDDPKTEVDPDFDLAGALIDSGLGGLLDKVLKDEDGPQDLGKIIGDLFKKK